MHDFQRMAVFAAVVEQSSMSAAAKRLDMTPSAVSQHIRQLERQAGVPLLHRTTRKLTLTDAGQRFFVQCVQMCEAAARAQAELAAERQEPSGELRMSAPAGFSPHVTPALGAWLARQPSLRLHLLLDDLYIDLIEARIDLALRYGTLTSSNWIARRLGRFELLLCASPQWLHDWQAARGKPPGHPAELSQARWISRTHTSPTRPDLHWSHKSSGEVCDLHVTPDATINQYLVMQRFCEAGLGLAILASHDAAESLQQGRLIHLLPEWRIDHLDIWAVTPQRDALPAKVREAIQVLRAYFARLQGVQAKLDADSLI